MDIEEAIFTRRSVRKYLDKPVEDEIISKIISAGFWAPSACNRQGWKFIVIKDKKIKEELVREGVIHLKNPPAGIFVLYDKRNLNKEYQDHIQSGAAAIQNMHLMAHSLGIGTCWVAHLPRKKRLRRLLDIPWNYEPIALVTLGYYEKKPKAPKRKFENVEELVCYNRFNFKKGIPTRKDYLAQRIILIVLKIWELVPNKTRDRIRRSSLGIRIKSFIDRRI